MSTYRAKINHDVALVSLTVLDPQPDPGTAIAPTRRTYGGDGSVYDEGNYIELHWSAIDTASAYQTLLGVFGLNASTAYANVTVYVRDVTYAWVRMNGIAVRPIAQSDVEISVPSLGSIWSEPPRAFGRRACEMLSQAVFGANRGVFEGCFAADRAVWGLRPGSFSRISFCLKWGLICEAQSTSLQKRRNSQSTQRRR